MMTEKEREEIRTALAELSKEPQPEPWTKEGKDINPKIFAKAQEDINRAISEGKI